MIPIIFRTSPCNSTKVVSNFFPALIVLFILLASSIAATAGLASEVIERVIRSSGRMVDDAVRVAGKEAVEKGIAKYGDEVARITESGGFGIAEAAAKHGDEVWRLARIDSDISRAMAHRADDLLGIGRRWGDDAAIIEARAPGCGNALAKNLPPQELAHLVGKASPEELQRLAIIASHRPANEAKAVTAFWGNSGGRALNYLTPARIAALGLSVAMITAAVQAPESIISLVKVALTGFLGPVMTVCSWIIVLVVLIYLRKPLLWLVRRIARLAKSVWSAAPNPEH